MPTTNIVQALSLVFFIALGLPNSASAQVEEPVTVDSTLEIESNTWEEAVQEYPAENPYTSEYTPPPVKPVAMRDIDKRQWEDAVDGLDYSKDVPKPVKEQKQPAQRSFDPDWNASTAVLGKIMQVLAIILAIAAIGYGIYRSLHAPRNRRISTAVDGTIITSENVDAYIHETDLERFLREALATGNYPLAVRLYYLQAIKLLSEKEAIKWSREKTNRDYLREMRDHRHGREFREITRTFEQVWYGNAALDRQAFEPIEPEFIRFIALTKQTS